MKKEIVKRNEIIKFVNSYLDIKKWPNDYSNGLVVKGSDLVSKIATGVTPSIELFEKAKKYGAEMIICHHYLHLKKEEGKKVPEYEKKRIQCLRKNNINFANYHLPLDFHNEIGNEKLTLEEFGLELSNSKYYFNGGLYGGKLKKSTTVGTLSAKAKKIYGHVPIVYAFGPKKVSNVAVITGSGHGFLEDAYKKGAQTILTGCLKVESPDVAKELEMNLIASGHHNTEKVGIKALGELVSKKFGIKHKFINIPNIN